MANVLLLKRRWREFWVTHHKVFSPIAEAVWESLHHRYTESWRAYHTLDHIEFCLDIFDEALRKITPRSINTVEVAIWFHDAVYNTHKSDNELQSVLLANDKLQALGMNEQFRDEVKRLILATEHNRELTDRPEQFIADIDLSSLGQDWGVFEEHGRAIRQEYSWVPIKDYREGRTAVLKRFLERPQGIYYLPYFKQRYESQARVNLERAIAELS